MTRILIVEDDPVLRRTLELNLRARQYETIATGNGEDAVLFAGRELPDLVLLDLGLPGIDGTEVIDTIRTWSTMPIVVLSARDAEADKVEALDKGADDYLTKPFGIEELMARVRAALRTRQPPPARIETPDFVIDMAAQTVQLASGEAVHLTPIEWGLLAHVASAAGQLVSHRTLLRAVWGPEYENQTNYLRVHMAHLRRKIEPVPSEPRYLITESGLGFRLVVDP